MKNREIKFRVWDVENKKLHYPNLIAISRTGGCRIGEKEFFYPETCVIQRFTGLKDKNGKEIFEGDLLKIENFEEEKSSFQNYIVEFSYGSFNLLSVEIWKQKNPLLHGISDYRFMEIIGNIFENPELLK